MAGHPGDVRIRDATRDAAPVILEVHSEERACGGTCPGSCAAQHPEAAHRPASLQCLPEEEGQRSPAGNCLPKAGSPVLSAMLSTIPSVCTYPVFVQRSVHTATHGMHCAYLSVCVCAGRACADLLLYRFTV